VLGRNQIGFVLNSLSILDILSWQLAEGDGERLGDCKIGLGRILALGQDVYDQVAKNSHSYSCIPG
jgi:hypothetical protein